MKINDRLIDDVLENEQSLIDLFSFCTLLDENKYALRYSDDLLKDMYDHNFTSVVGRVDEALLYKINEYKNSRNESHTKITSLSKEEFLLEKGFEEGLLLTMVKEDFASWPKEIDSNLIFKNQKENDIENDVLKLELFEYGNVYGEDFTSRKISRYMTKAKEKDNGLNYFAAYINGELVGYLYSYYNHNVVAIDGLLVKKEFRHKGIATSLLEYVALYYKCPIYLHADNDETPKEMYEKLGFVTIEKTYEYLLLDNIS